MRLPFVLLALTGALLLAGCGDADDERSAPGAVDVVATTTVLGDLARAVGGRDADVHRLLQPSSDPHDYEPRPDDVVAVSRARLVLTSGHGLDGWSEDVVEQAGGDPRVLDLGAHAPVVREDAAGDTDPHWWHDPRNVEAAVVAIRDALAQANPAARSGYAQRAAVYLRRLRALDAAITRCVAAIPPARRALVTDHDAFGYFAERYDIRIVGTVIPSLTTQAQPSAGDLAQLTRTIERERVATVFAARSVNAKLARAIADEAGARVDDSLYGDTLGPPGSAGETYLAMEAHDADAIVRGLGDGRRGCPAALAAAAS